METLIEYNSKIIKKDKSINKIVNALQLMTPYQSFFIKNEEELNQEYGVFHNAPGLDLRYKAEIYRKYIFDKRIRNSRLFQENIKRANNISDTVYLLRIDDIGLIEIPLSVIKIDKDNSPFVEIDTEDEDAKFKTYSLISKISDIDKKEIINEMISKVDLDVFEKLLRIANDRNKVNKEIVDFYLDTWAKSKIEFYIMMGRNLCCDKDFSIEADKAEIRILMNELGTKFPKYESILSSFNISDIINNNIGNASDLIKYVICNLIEEMKIKSEFDILLIEKIGLLDFITGKIQKEHPVLKKYHGEYGYDIGIDTFDYMRKWIIDEKLNDYIDLMDKIVKFNLKSGMKTSKFLSQLLDDQKFDIELSKIMQNRKNTGKIAISINPIDYLMSSVNKYNWSTCHRIFSGSELKYGTFAYMIDDSTIISYIHNGKKQLYDKVRYSCTHYGDTNLESTDSSYEFDEPFEYYSFRMRENIHIDKNTSACAFSLGYCNMDKETYKHIRFFLEELLSQYFRIDNDWLIVKPNIHGKNTNKDNNYKYKIGDSSNGKVYLDPIQSIIYPKDTDIYEANFTKNISNKKITYLG